MDEDRVTVLEGRVKEIKYRLDELETGIEIDSIDTNTTLNELSSDQEDDRKRIDELENRVTGLEVRVVEIVDELGVKRLDLLEEKVAVLETLNAELKDHHCLLVDHHNSLIDKFNIVTALLNKDFNNREPSVEQPSVEQVYAMYQSQPPDEEGWEEMTNAIEAAEEYEALHKIPSPVKGFIDN